MKLSIITYLIELNTNFKELKYNKNKITGRLNMRQEERKLKGINHLIDFQQFFLKKNALNFLRLFIIFL